ncbi:hypothetical protein Tco_1428629 [Tanacetum coccineum]
MYGPCVPCGKCSRLQQMLQAATTEVVGCCRGCHIGRWEGCNGACWLLQRLPHKLLPHKLQAVGKAGMELAGCCEGCHISCCWEGYNGACWLLRRLPHKLQAAAKALTLLGRLQHCWEGFHDVGKVAVKANIEVVGCCEGCQATAKATRLLLRLSGYYKGCQATTRMLGYYEGYRAVVKAARLLPKLL